MAIAGRFGCDGLLRQGGLPAMLQSLTFGVDFNQPVEKVEWPASLQRLTFGGLFNQWLARVDWPPSLQQLTLGGYNSWRRRPTQRVVRQKVRSDSRPSFMAG
ncbi:unnamed protein product, partial [Laminaria digitata]